MVRRPQFAISHARGLPDEFDVEPGIDNVGLDLLQRAAGQKAPGCRNKGDAPAIGKARTNANHTLFGDANVDQPVWKFLLESTQF